MARKFTAPGIERLETDISEVVAPVGTSTGAIVGGATKGPVNARTLVGTDKEFIEKFGNPNPDWLASRTTDTVDAGIYGALEFLQESGALYFTRVADGTEVYANRILTSDSASAATDFTATSATALVALGRDANKANEIYDIDNYGSGGFNIASIGPGAYGNNVGIKVTTSASHSSTWTSATSAFVESTSANVDWDFFYDNPETDGSASSAADAKWKKVFKIEVFTRTTTADSFPTTAIEEFYGSLGDLLGPDGSNLNIEQRVNGISKYIYVKNYGLTAGTNPMYVSATTALANGADSSTVMNASNLENGWEFYTDREKVTVNILVGTTYGTTTGYQTAMKKPVEVAVSRQDCIATMQVGRTSVIDPTSIINESNGLTFTIPSYGAKYAGWSLVYDSFNDKNVYIPNSLFGGVIMARTDRIANTWNAPAGIRRGVLPVLGQSVKFSKTQIGNLYDANINAIKFINGQGNVIWGQRTAQKTVTALREIAVRRLLLFLENTIEPSLLSFIFEPNNDSTRLRIFSIIDSFLSGVQSGGGLQQYKVVVDDTNNSADDVDNNILNVDIYVQPTRTIEFIQLQMVITRSGVSLAEVTV